MAFNKETNQRMEDSAREAYSELLTALSNMNEHERAGAEVVIRYFTKNYMQAGYKKLARKLVKKDIDA